MTIADQVMKIEKEIKEKTENINLLTNEKEELRKKLVKEGEKKLRDYLKSNGLLIIERKSPMFKMSEIVEYFYDRNNLQGIIISHNLRSKKFYWLESIEKITEENFKNLYRLHKASFVDGNLPSILKLGLAFGIIPFFYDLILAAIIEKKESKYSRKFGKEVLINLSEKYNL